MRFEVEQTPPSNEGSRLAQRNQAGASKAGGECPKREVGIGFTFRSTTTALSSIPSNGRLYHWLSGRGGNRPIFPFLDVGDGFGRLSVLRPPFVDVVKSSLVPISVRTPKEFPLAEAARVANPFVDGAIVD